MVCQERQAIRVSISDLVHRKVTHIHVGAGQTELHDKGEKVCTKASYSTKTLLCKTYSISITRSSWDESITLTHDMCHPYDLMWMIEWHHIIRMSHEGFMYIQCRWTIIHVINSTKLQTVYYRISVHPCGILCDSLWFLYSIFFPLSFVQRLYFCGIYYMCCSSSRLGVHATFVQHSDYMTSFCCSYDML